MRNNSRWFISLVFICALLAVVLRADAGLSALWLNLAARDAAKVLVQHDDLFGAPCGAAPAELAQARSWSQRAIQLQPEDAHAARVAGKIEWLQGDCSGALMTWRTHLAKPAKAQDWIRFDLARALYQEGDLPHAAIFFRELNATNYVQGVANSQLQQGETTKAQDLYALALTIRPSAADADALSGTYAQQGQAIKALDVWQRVADTTTANEALHWVAAGEIARRRDQLPAAQQAFRKGITLANDPYDLYMRLGDVLLQMGKWAEAIASYGQAIAWGPRASSVPYRQAALAELQLGHYAAAMEWYDRASAAIPTGDPWPNIEAGKAALEHNDVAEAERRYRRALDQSPNHAAALYYLAKLLYQGGRVTEAIHYMESVNDHDFRCEGLNLLIDWYREVGNLIRSQAVDVQHARECSP